MRLSKADPANCVRAILTSVLRRWLWLMPNPTTARFLRETERTIIIACWTQPGPGHSVNILSCNVGLFQPKTFQVPVTDLYIFIKIYSEIGPMMHVLRTGCSRNPQPHLRTWWDDPAQRQRGSWSHCHGADHAVFTKVTGAFHCWWGWGLLWFLFQPDMYRMFETVCTFDVILHFQSHQSILWILCVCGLIIMVTTVIPFSPFCLQGNMPIFLSFLFCLFFFLWKEK